MADRSVSLPVIEEEEPTKPALSNAKERQTRQLRNLLSDFESLVSDFRKEDSFSGATEALSDEPCTDKNWKGFLPYLTFSSDTGRYIETPLPSQESATSKPLRIIRIENEDTISIEILSERLQEIFLEIVNVSLYEGVFVTSKLIAISFPYAPFYHELERLRESVSKDALVSEEEKKHFEALYYCFTFDFPQQHFKNIRRLLSRGFIYHDFIWALFPANSLAVRRDHLRNWEVLYVEAIRRERNRQPFGDQGFKWTVTASSIVSVAAKYQKLTRTYRVEPFIGLKRIQDLDIFPVEYLENHETIKQAIIEGGKTWKQYCEAGPKVMSYQGQAVPVFQRIEEMRRTHNSKTFSTVSVSLESE